MNVTRYMTYFIVINLCNLNPFQSGISTRYMNYNTTQLLYGINQLSSYIPTRVHVRAAVHPQQVNPWLCLEESKYIFQLSTMPGGVTCYLNLYVGN